MLFQKSGNWLFYYTIAKDVNNYFYTIYFQAPAKVPLVCKTLA